MSDSSPYKFFEWLLSVGGELPEVDLSPTALFDEPGLHLSASETADFYSLFNFEDDAPPDLVDDASSTAAEVRGGTPLSDKTEVVDLTEETAEPEVNQPLKQPQETLSYESDATWTDTESINSHEGYQQSGMYAFISDTVCKEDLQYFQKLDSVWATEFIDPQLLLWKVGDNVLLKPLSLALQLGLQTADGRHAPCVNSLNRFLYTHKPGYNIHELTLLRIENYEQSHWRLVKVHLGVHCFNECTNKLFARGTVPNLSLRGEPKYRCEIVRNSVKGFCLLLVERVYIEADQFIMEYIGVVTTYPAISSSYVAKVDNKLYIDSADLGNKARFINSSETPEQANCRYYTEVIGPVRMVNVYTTKAIDARDGPVELLTYYAETNVVEAEDILVV
ncbi:hypothetical protein CYMTET_27270 [Cymbomonas tetramitiformis]|uniref:SET domain-containing protein n=1 Tax=Cymbomonas tetramitiformis TaxID=36881 RepID=A0AAE0KTS5_9CHLO|nr:hypothetical protein CYMTET_30580 [Cymbomonas tetramitiformis]KAK3263958.1 hypothetical protein CYMTET_27270 [Cymbomonas tetramitiformis]|eukprot:gene26559-32604_t